MVSRWFCVCVCVYGQSNVLPNPCRPMWLTCIPGWAVKPVENFTRSHCCGSMRMLTYMASPSHGNVARGCCAETSAYQIQCGNGIRQVTCFASSSNALFLLFPKTSLAGSQFQRSGCLARLLPANTSHAVCRVLARWAILWFVFHPRSLFSKRWLCIQEGECGSDNMCLIENHV